MSVCVAGGVGGVDGAGAEVFGAGVDSCLDGTGCSGERGGGAGSVQLSCHQSVVRPAVLHAPNTFDFIYISDYFGI